MRRVLVAGALFLLATSCVSTTPAGDAVRITSNPEVVKGCEFLGPVKAKSGWGGFAAQGLGERNSMAALQNKAARMGADVVLMVTSHVGFGGAQQRGEAYRCKAK